MPTRLNFTLNPAELNGVKHPAPTAKKSARSGPTARGIRAFRRVERLIRTAPFGERRCLEQIAELPVSVAVKKRMRALTRAWVGGEVEARDELELCLNRQLEAHRSASVRRSAA